MGGNVEERRNAERINRENLRHRGIVIALGLVALLLLVSLVNAFYFAPLERDEIRNIAEEAEALAQDVEDTNEARLEAQTGFTALACTGQNRHDSIDRQTLKTLIDSGLDLTDLLARIPPATNCGELLCQIIAAVEENAEEAIIELDDPFGPDRPKTPCVSA
jgi:flagellar biosynthesis/type III secretory pathway M-ring protein FliF/YscJ